MKSKYEKRKSSNAPKWIRFLTNKVFPEEKLYLQDVYTERIDRSIISVNSFSRSNINEIYDSLEDGRLTRFYYRKIRIIDTIIGIFIVFTLFFNILHCDYSFDHLNDKFINNSLLSLILIFSLLTILFTFFRYYFEIKLKKSRREISKRENLLTSGNFVSLIGEILLHLIFPYSFCSNLHFSISNYESGNSYTIYQINQILSMFAFLRLIILARVFLNFTVYLSPRAYRLCKIYGCPFGYMYAIKCLFKTIPLKFLLIVMGSSVLILAFILRICERPLRDLVSSGNQLMSMEYYMNSLWCTLVTISTIGYGDFYPRTVPGKIVCFFIGFWGIIMMSIIVVTITNILEMDVAESKALNLLIRLEQRIYLKQEAATIISSMYKYKKAKRNGRMSKPIQKEFLKKLKRNINKFVTTSRKIQKTYDVSNIYEIMGTYFDCLREEIKGIRSNQDLLLVKLGLENKKEEIKKIPENSNTSKSEEEVILNQNKSDIFEVPEIMDDFRGSINYEEKEVSSQKNLLN